jgi:hypothetical protein
MFGTRSVPVRFHRRIQLAPGEVIVVDELQRTGDIDLTGLMFGDEFAVRYVPQSRFFQSTDLEAQGYALPPEALGAFQTTGRVRVTRRVDVASGQVTVELDDGLPAPLIGDGASVRVGGSSPR